MIIHLYFLTTKFIFTPETKGIFSMKPILSRHVLLPLMSIITFMLSIVVFFAAWLMFSGNRIPGASNPRMSPIVEAIRKAIPSVVNISTERVIGTTSKPSGTSFMGASSEIVKSQDQNRSYSLGSGCVISSAGIVLTNAHVVQRASKINIKLSDNRIYQGLVFAEDSLNDIALVMIEDPPSNLAEISCEYGAKPMLGESVIALGNPFGLDSSVTRGVISALDRKFTQEENVMFSDIIQTDAVVYPGNSGGPLINQSGNMIGMNVAFHKSAHGISFAIPLPRIERVIAKWLIPERTDNLFFGVIPDEIVSESGIREFVVADIIPLSPAEKAGLRKGDIITSIDGERFPCLLSLSRKLISVKENKEVRVSLKSGKTLSVTPVRMENYDGVMQAKQKLAIEVNELNSNIAQLLGFSMTSGVVVSAVLNGGGEIKRGDIIFSIDDFVIHSMNDLSSVLARYQPGDSVDITLMSFPGDGAKQKPVKKTIDFTIR